MAKLRTCKICGKQYEYCGHCPSKNLIEPWRNLYCSEECRDAFEIMGKYAVGKIAAIEAREKLESFGLSPSKVRDIHKGVVSTIFREGKKAVYEEPKLVPIPEKVSVEEETFQKPFKKRERQRKSVEGNNDIVNED